jgi:hypothetical protein
LMSWSKLAREMPIQNCMMFLTYFFLMFICTTAIAWLHSWVDLDIEHFAEDFDILIELASRLVDLKVDSFTVNCLVIFELPNFLHLSALTINYNKI